MTLYEQETNRHLEGVAFLTGNLTKSLPTMGGLISFAEHPRAVAPWQRPAGLEWISATYQKGVIIMRLPFAVTAIAIGNG